MTPIKQNLIDRGVNFEIVKPIIDEKTNTAVFNLFALSGKICGYQRYNPDGIKVRSNDERKTVPKLQWKYFTHVTNVDNIPEIAVFGLESLREDTQIIYIVEGIFDAIKLINTGRCALAMLTATPSNNVKNWLKLMPQLKIVILDNDEDNKETRKLGSVGDLVYPTPYGFKDLGEMEQKHVNRYVEFIERYLIKMTEMTKNKK